MIKKLILIVLFLSTGFQARQALALGGYSSKAKTFRPQAIKTLKPKSSRRIQRNVTSLQDISLIGHWEISSVNSGIRGRTDDSPFGIPEDTSETDRDSDGIADSLDNCPDVSNPDQTDINGDRVGAACDPCPEGTEGPNDLGPGKTPSGIISTTSTTSTPSASDEGSSGTIIPSPAPGSGVGVEVPSTIDSVDGVNPNIFYCPILTTTTYDSDEDGFSNDVDNCPFVNNADQTDADLDGVGAVCDRDDSKADVDGDGINDRDDNCPSTANAAQTDADRDRIGTACDPDDSVADWDNDGVANSLDNCPDVPNSDQEDSRADSDDASGGDACDNYVTVISNPDDLDADGVLDDVDNCPSWANDDQTDTDDDGVGDVCET